MKDKKLNYEELRSLLVLIELKLDKLEEARSLWKDFDEDIPEFILEDNARYCALRNKIIEMMN